MSTQLELTVNNHFKFDYNGNGQPFRQSQDQCWSVNYGLPRRPMKNFFFEAISAAQEIEQKYTAPKNLFLSGGIDSEFVARVFLSANVNFKCTIIRFPENLNEHDIKFAINFCEKNSISYTIFDLDVIDFWKTKSEKYVLGAQCFSPQLIVPMYVADHFSEDYIIIGSGEPHVCKNQNGWVLLEKERIAAFYRFFIWKNRWACPAFFQYTPELVFSYFQDPMVLKMIDNQFPDLITNTSIKYDHYIQFVAMERRDKYTGYELLQNQDAYFRAQFKAILGLTADDRIETEVSYFKT